MAGSLLLLIVVVGSLLQSSPPPPPPLLGPSSSRSRSQRCGVRCAERGVVRVSAKGCSMRRDVGGGEGNEDEGGSGGGCARGEWEEIA
jgi:hypothetical protein